MTILRDQTLRSAGADSKLDRRDHHAPDLAPPARKAKCTTAAVTFAADVEGFSLPLRQYDMSDTEPAVLLVAPPTYVLFPIDGEVPLSTSPVSLVPVLPGLAPIGPLESLATPLVAADTLSQDFTPTGLLVSLFSSGPLLPSRVQPVLDETREVRHTSSRSDTIPAIGTSPVESALAGNSLSPDSEWSDGSFYSAASSPTGPTPAMDPAPVLAPSFFCEGPFAVRLPTLGSGIIRVVVPTISQLTGIMTMLFRLDTLLCRSTTNRSWSGWGLRNPPTY